MAEVLFVLVHTPAACYACNGPAAVHAKIRRVAASQIHPITYVETTRRVAPYEGITESAAGAIVGRRRFAPRHLLIAAPVEHFGSPRSTAEPIPLPKLWPGIPTRPNLYRSRCAVGHRISKQLTDPHAVMPSVLPQGAGKPHSAKAHRLMSPGRNLIEQHAAAAIRPGWSARTGATKPPSSRPRRSSPAVDRHTPDLPLGVFSPIPPESKYHHRVAATLPSPADFTDGGVSRRRLAHDLGRGNE
jgi:hypothetical protein